MARVVVKPNYVVEDLRNPPKDQIAGYRRKKVSGHVLTLAILRRAGPRGGRTIVTSVWHPKGEKEADNPKVQAMLRRLRKG